VELAKSGLIERGFHRFLQMNSRPPKLTAKFGNDADQRNIEEVVDFLHTVPHCEAQVNDPDEGASN
jgi:hypothetical protein